MAFESVMAIMGIQIKRATVQQDLQGIDYVVCIDDNREFKIDIKTSQRRAEEANIRNAYYGNGVTAFCPFSRNTLREIPTILPKDPYSQLLIPALETASRLLKERLITEEKYTDIKEDLIKQIEKMEGHMAYV